MSPGSTTSSWSTEVYVQPFPASGAKWQISTAGGRTPFWIDHGREVAFLDLEGSGAFVASIRVTGASMEVSLPRPLFRRSLAGGGIFRNRWVPTAAGDRFLLNARKDAGEAPTFRVVLDWPAELAPR